MYRLPFILVVVFFCKETLFLNSIGLCAGSKFENGGNFVGRVDKKWWKLYRLSQRSIISMSWKMESWCVVYVGNHLFSNKINLQKVFRALYFPSVYK